MVLLPNVTIELTAPTILYYLLEPTLVISHTKVINSLVSFQRSREEQVGRPHGEGVVLFPRIAAGLASLAILHHEADDDARVGGEVVVVGRRLVDAVDFRPAESVLYSLNMIGKTYSIL